MEPTNEEVSCAIVADLHNAKQALRNFQINVRRNTPAFEFSQKARAALLWCHGEPMPDDFVNRVTNYHEEELKKQVSDFEQELAAFDAQHPELTCLTIFPMRY